MCLLGAWRRKAPTAPSAKLDDKYKRLRRVVAKLAHKAQWHNKRNAPIYASTECCPLRSSSVGSLKRSVEGERNGGNTVRKGESCIDVIIKRTLITSALSLFSTIINLAQL